MVFYENRNFAYLVLDSAEELLLCRANKLLYRSVVFESMLKQNMREAQTNEVDIPDVDPDTLKLMLEFIYSGQVGIRLFSKNVGTITLYLILSPKR